MISIICPVYNSEKYIADCVNSVLRQSFHDWELILVDDGSTDDSLAMCEEFAKKDKRIKVFHKQNEGQWLTREFGIKKSSGDYFIFLDSDDMLEDFALLEISKRIEPDRPNMMLYDICKLDASGNKTCLQELYEEKTLTGVKDIVDFCFVMNNCISLCVYCFKRSFYDKIVFDASIDKTIKGQEDFLMLFNIVKCLDKLIVIPRVLYDYRTNEMSTTKHLTVHDYLKNVQISNQIYSEIFKKYNCDLKSYSFKIKKRLAYQPLSFIKRAYRELSKTEQKSSFKIVKRTLIYKAFTKKYRFESRKDRLIVRLFGMNFHLLNRKLSK